MRQPLFTARDSVRRTARLRDLSIAALAAALIATGFSTGVADNPDQTAAFDAYLRDVAKAQANLNEGRIAAVKTLLEMTDRSLRSVEFDYLQARAAAAGTEGNPAPDLIRTIIRPAEVESRYAVLNPVHPQVVFICRDGSLRVYELNSKETPPKEFKHAQGAAVWSGVFSNDGKTFLSGHQNSEVLVWDATTWKVRHTISLGEDWAVRELAVAPDGTACVAESKTALELWSLTGETPRKVAAVGERYTFGEGLAFSPKGDVLATGGMFDILLFDAKTGASLHSLQHASYTMGLEFSPDGTRIASAPRGNVNRFLAVFDVGRSERLFNAGPFGNYIAGMAFSPDGKRIIATGCEKVVRVFDSTTGKVVLSFDRKECGSKPFFSADGRLFGWNEPQGFLLIDLKAARQNSGAP